MDTPELTGTAAKARLLASHVTSLLIEEALKDARFRHTITVMEELLKTARETVAAGPPDLAAAAGELRQGLQLLTQRPPVSAWPLLKEHLERRHVRRIQLVERQQRHLEKARGELLTRVEQLGLPMLRVMAQAGQLAATRPRPGQPYIGEMDTLLRSDGPGAASPGGTPQVRAYSSPRRRRTRLTAVSVALGAAVLLYLLFSRVYVPPSYPTAGQRAATRVAASRVQPAPPEETSAPASLEPDTAAPAPEEPAVTDSPQEPPAWRRLWDAALAQPVSGCPQKPGAGTFGACACPDAAAEADSEEGRCPPQEDWSEPVAIAAVEAVLKVNHPDVWVDGEPGPELARALESLPGQCELTDEDDRALAALAGESLANPPGNREAALRLLRYYQKHPRCAE